MRTLENIWVAIMAVLCFLSGTKWSKPKKVKVISAPYTPTSGLPDYFAGVEFVNVESEGQTFRVLNQFSDCPEIINYGAEDLE